MQFLGGDLWDPGSFWGSRRHLAFVLVSGGFGITFQTGFLWLWCGIAWCGGSGSAFGFVGSAFGFVESSGRFWVMGLTV